MTSGHLEVETKYDVDDGFVLPDVTGLPGVVSVGDPVEHLLVAVYLDTDDLRLLRARVTLRRRTGGTDEGWHLKLPAGSARREIHAPLGRATKNAPRALREPIAGILRGSRARPVATLRTRRVVTTLRDADGEVLAEIADDEVTATVSGVGDGPVVTSAWREVEVELGAGDEAQAAVVGERLVAAGARISRSASKVGRALVDRLSPGDGGTADPTTVGEFLRGVLGEQVAALQLADVQLRTERPDAVHQVRIGARRLRSTLAAFRAVLDRAVTDPLREELSWLGGQLASARDDEVALEHLRAVVAAEPVELVLGPVAARLQQTELRGVRAGLDRTLLTLSEPRYLRLLDDLHALLADPPFTARAAEPVRPVLRDAIRRTARRLRRALAHARTTRGTDRAEALHDVRKAAKRVRYATEVGRGQLAHVKPLVRSAKRIQKVLGDLQDTVVTREQCRRLGIAAAAAGESAFTYGRLHGLEQARGVRAEQKFRAVEQRIRPTLQGTG